MTVLVPRVKFRGPLSGNVVLSNITPDSKYPYKRNIYFTANSNKDSKYPYKRNIYFAANSKIDVKPHGVCKTT